MRWLAVILALALVACDYVEETRDVGHKGRARVNPYLAAERLLERLDYEVVSKPGWPAFEGEEAMVLMPASVLGAEGYVRDLEQWTQWGGHTVIFLERGETFLSDWNELPDWRHLDQLMEKDATPFEDWAGRAGLTISGSRWDGGDKTLTEEVVIEGETFEVSIETAFSVEREGKESPLISVPYGEGRLTVVADARPFRNRYIGDYDHASLLARLVELSPCYGTVSFVRNASLSFWALLWNRGWPALVALLLLVAFWLWKNLPRFGPLDSVESEGILRAYDHHLESLGDFHWRLDRGEGLLRPLRESLVERAHRLAISTGRPDADIFDLMAERSGIPRERAERAMTFERARDAGGFTRLVADLQKLHLSIP
ncbi:DUF4350 domain-containing protein [Haloferula sp. A504]|uniref:DUF4350 domain-containing protein n=1 Tax=Haloferula sp. A504 TaxID=3373601 RepID=UPI0031C187FF|nr:hypothetical protein [Verrucomicrobiaceae bacterium E54]